MRALTIHDPPSVFQGYEDVVSVHSGRDRPDQRGQAANQGQSDEGDDPHAGRGWRLRVLPQCEKLLNTSLSYGVAWHGVEFYHQDCAEEAVDALLRATPTRFRPAPVSCIKAFAIRTKAWRRSC